MIDNGKVTPKIKLSNDIIKIVNPGYKCLYRAFDKDSGYAVADIVCEKDEILPEDEMLITSLSRFDKSTVIRNYELKPLQETIFLEGEYIYDQPELKDKITYCQEQVNKLYPEVRRILNPHEYYVDGSERYIELKKKMIKEAGEKRV